MNKDQLEGKWEQFTGELKKIWGRLMHDEKAQMDGNHRKFFGALKERYAIAREGAKAGFRRQKEKCPACSRVDAV